MQPAALGCCVATGSALLSCQCLLFELLMPSWCVSECSPATSCTLSLGQPVPQTFDGCNHAVWDALCEVPCRCCDHTRVCGIDIPAMGRCRDTFLHVGCVSVLCASNVQGTVTYLIWSSVMRRQHDLTRHVGRCAEQRHQDNTDSWDGTAFEA